MKKPCDGVAIQIFAKDGRREAKAVLQCYNEEAIAILLSLQGAPGIVIERVVLRRDVFDKLHYVACNSDD